MLQKIQHSLQDGTMASREDQKQIDQQSAATLTWLVLGWVTSVLFPVYEFDIPKIKLPI